MLLEPRKGVLRILGKGERVRQVPLHPTTHATLNGWLAERADWPGATDTFALFLNQRGQRLSVRGAHDIITGIAAAAGIDDDTTVHILRHTFATTLDLREQARGIQRLAFVAVGPSVRAGEGRVERWWTSRAMRRSSRASRSRG